ncbi:MAG: DNA-3-methyladenine glycosylase I [Clostridia bacterium]|nr:DNA-3-methyladenine glycosylase I [Clostridia bacterium]
MNEIVRCPWSEGNERLRAYHDTEWGVPVRDDRHMYEHLFLEAMQCGLNWNMMLVKRDIFRQCFDGFDYEQVARYDEDRVQEILAVPGMIRSRPKILAEINNARRVMEVAREFGSFSEYLWRYVEGRTLVYRSHAHAMPAKNALSEVIAADMKKRGFKYLGPVTLYSHLQACGIINDHDVDCFRYRVLVEQHPVRFLDE